MMISEATLTAVIIFSHAITLHLLLINPTVRLARLTAGSTKAEKSVILDDLLLSNEQGGTHDYDWLITPPETPFIPCSGKGSQPISVTPKKISSVRSGSTTRTSRLSVSPSECSHQSRPERISSVTRPPISTTRYTNNSNRNSNILSTNSASVSSYVRPSSPANRSSSLAARSFPNSPRTKISRASTPSRNLPSSTSTSIDRTTRPSTPTHRTHTPTNLTTSPIVRPPSRPSTPTRRSPTLSHAPSSNGRSVGPASRPSSPTSRVRSLPQPINLPDFPHETPPNLRTTLPERPLSAGRSRPGTALTVKGHVENTNSGSMSRRQPSPTVTRGRIAEPPGKGRPHGNGHVIEILESRRTLHVSESITRKPIKMLNSESGTGFGRSISKNSLDMAIKHMDIRNGGTRPLSGSTLFPQSIRSGNPRMQPSHTSNAAGSVNGSFSNGINPRNENLKSTNYENSGHINSENKITPISVEHRTSYLSKLKDMDMYESSRYDAILLKEDLKNTSWLHSADENSDLGPLFDNGFERLPEPFAPL
uniref:cell wall protein DAN4-like isoform X2 n=1 Tax=Erigeron canadensis TaxID=72917 RepID=UPI001CB96BDE|nr:cell wall protein DAN4-like isoform X2 [Erigeron canadensis]